MAATPTETTQITTSIPTEVKPNYQRLVNDVEKFAEQPYQYYQGQRYADINPLETQYYQGTTNLTPSSEQSIAAGNMASQAGLGALDSGMFGNEQAQQYMSPYIQNVLNVQKQSATRDYNRQLPGLQAAGAKFGAIGGSRAAIAQAEGMRNLQNSLQGIDATGLQNAWQNAQAQYNSDQTRRMQGYQIANQSANNLNQIGDTYFNQRLGTLNAQRQAGADLFGRSQQPLDFNYQQFTEEQNRPYQNFALRNSTLQGIPMGNETRSVYGQNSPVGSFLGNAYGVYNLYRANNASNNNNG
jgi:hypothetical protein